MLVPTINNDHPEQEPRSLDMDVLIFGEDASSASHYHRITVTTHPNKPSHQPLPYLSPTDKPTNQLYLPYLSTHRAESHPRPVGPRRNM